MGRELTTFDIRHLPAFVRWREWSDSKLPFYLVAMCYAVLRLPDPGARQAAQMAELFVLLCLYAAFGHIINDYADREADRRAGKRKLLASWSEPAALTAIMIPCAGIIVLAALCFDATTIVLTLLALLLAALYSLPPVRLKIRGILGWTSAALAQRTLPLAIVFQALGHWDRVAVVLCAQGTLIGLRFIITHQLHDRDNDLRAGVATLATEQNPQVLVALLRGLFCLEIVCGLTAVAAMAYYEPPLGVMALVYAAGLGLAIRRGRPVSPLQYFVFAGFYQVIWPVTLAVLLAVRDPLFVPVVLVAVALVHRLGRLTFRATFLEAQADAPQMRRGDARVARPNPASNLEIDKADPYPVYARFRAMKSVVRLDWPGIGHFWAVTRHQDALTVFKDSRFVRSANVETSFGQATSPGVASYRGFGRDMAESDPPDHTRLRKLVSTAFTPRVVARCQTRIEQLAGRILDRASTRGEIELISEYASIIPITIIAELLGMPIADTGKLRELVHSLTLSQILRKSSSTLEAEKSRLTDDLNAVFAARREEPRDDLISALVRAEQDGDRLSADELIGMVYLLLLAGFVTTTNLIGNGMMVLLRHPDQLDMLRRDPGLADTAIEELLRFESPLELSTLCFASDDIELTDGRIPRGAAVRVLIPAANRDDAQFAAPDTLDITRDPCPHLSFGQGIHHCLGAPLARLEGKIALRILIERLPNLRLADPARVEWMPHPMFRGLQRLPLRF